MELTLHIGDTAVVIPVYIGIAFAGMAALGAVVRLSMRMFWWLLLAAIILPLMAWAMGDGFGLSGFTSLWHGIVSAYRTAWPYMQGPAAAVAAVIGLVTGLFVTNKWVKS